MENKLPTIQDLHHNRELGFKQDSLNWLLNQNVPATWVKKHPMAGTNYLPIDKVEFLLQKIFGGYSVKIIGYNALFNSVAVHVRVTVINPVTGEIIEQDGVGAVPVQVDKGESASDLSKIKSNAITLALPSAESYAIKDACEKFGQIFGSNLGRKETFENTTFDKIADKWKI